MLKLISQTETESNHTVICTSLRILIPPMETPDLLNDTPGASKQLVLTVHDISKILRVVYEDIFF